MDEFIELAKIRKLNLSKDELNDKAFLAICGILVIHNNKALSPLEIAKELKSRDWDGFSGLAPATSINNHLRHRRATNLIRKHKLTGTKLDQQILPYIGVSGNRSSRGGVVYYLNGTLTGHKSPWEAAGVNDPYEHSSSSKSSITSSTSFRSSPVASTKRRFSDRITNLPRKSRKYDNYPLSPANSDNEDKPHRRLRSNHTVDINLDDLDDLPKPVSKPKSKPSAILFQEVEVKLEEGTPDTQSVEESLKPDITSIPARPPSPAQSEQEDEDDFHISMMEPSDTLPSSPGDVGKDSANHASQIVKSNELANMSSLEKELDELSPISNHMDCVESKEDHVVCNLATPPLSPKLSDDLSVDALEELDTLWTQQVDHIHRGDSLIDKDLFNSLNYVESIRAAARQ